MDVRHFHSKQTFQLDIIEISSSLFELHLFRSLVVVFVQYLATDVHSVTHSLTSSSA